jgi:O-methyltransferase
MNKLIRALNPRNAKAPPGSAYDKTYADFSSFTMIPREAYVDNLGLIEKEKQDLPSGCIVECGVWRGGMIASIATIMGNGYNYFLFDSFEGLPKAKEIDGQAAIDWQADTDSNWYFDNCKAEESYAEAAMKKAGISNYKLVRGWFSDTLPGYSFGEKICILRLDGDWYESTMDCLVNLYPLVEEKGLIIIDDYYAWEGCARAVHDYLSSNSLSARIRQFNNNICYIIKS